MRDAWIFILARVRPAIVWMASLCAVSAAQLYCRLVGLLCRSSSLRLREEKPKNIVAQHQM